MLEIYDKVCIECSRKTTRSYSTSFSLGTRFLVKKFRDPIYAVYGFVRFADEIVDTFHGFDKKILFARFKEDTWRAINDGISMNPILHSFQQVYRKYNFEPYLVETFLHSMEMDLEQQEYTRESYEKYILGSAEVVGLMCLKIFTEGEQSAYEKLKPAAMKLGAAFQKINFLRDLNADFVLLGRSYFPGLRMVHFNDEVKREIEREIEEDFKAGYEGIINLPKDARLGVYVAYVYYQRLFRKIQAIPSQRILEERIRIPNRKKFTLFIQSYLKHSLNLL